MPQRMLAFILVVILASSVISSQTRVDVRSSQRGVLRTFDPSRILGAAIDGHDAGELDRRLTSDHISEMLSAGLGPLTYRLRTELGNEAWHWNPRGTFSDGGKAQGYWTSSTDASGSGISLCYGYALPRRGNTIDQANNDGYSRIDDGDETTFWKSNPYLDTVFTQDDNSLHPQWVIVDLGKPFPVDAIQISWGVQFARAFDVEYSAQSLTSGFTPTAGWRPFARGRIAQSLPNDEPHELSQTPVTARFVRILLRTAASKGVFSTDVRDKVGFSIRELRVGTMAHGEFHDLVRHGSSASKQSTIFVSSTDPWHRASDIDLNEEHIGFDRLLATGLRNERPLMVPVGILYDTPENAAAEIEYLVKRGISFDRVELGEEPDGQNVSAADYATLYLQFAKAIRHVAPNVALGGPSFQDVVSNIHERSGNGRWLGHVLAYLRRRGHKKDFSFLSFEWYPFDDVCTATAPQVANSAGLMRRAVAALRANGIDRSIPLVVSEYGFSPYASAAEDDLEGAIVNLDGVGTMLSIGGVATFLYGYEPDRVEGEATCTRGNNMMLMMNADGSLTKTATFYAAQMMMNDWLEKGGGTHNLLAATSNAAFIGAYAVRRPDGKVAILLLNRHDTKPTVASVSIDGRSRLWEAVQFSHADYVWNTVLSRPDRDEPPESFETDRSGKVRLPPYSITVLREK